MLLFTMKKPFIFGPLQFNKYRVTISVKTDEIWFLNTNIYGIFFNSVQRKNPEKKCQKQREKNNAKSITKYVNIFLDLTLHYNDIKTFYLV